MRIEPHPTGNPELELEFEDTYVYDEPVSEFEQSERAYEEAKRLDKPVLRPFRLIPHKEPSQ